MYKIIIKSLCILESTCTMIRFSDLISLLIDEQCRLIEHCGIATTRENYSFLWKNSSNGVTQKGEWFKNW